MNPQRKSVTISLKIRNLGKNIFKLHRSVRLFTPLYITPYNLNGFQVIQLFRAEGNLSRRKMFLAKVMRTVECLAFEIGLKNQTNQQKNKQI